MVRLGLIGFPLVHSFSPPYFEQKIESSGLGGKVEYRPYPLRETEDLKKWLKLRGLKGVNVTIPHKRKAAAEMDELDNWAKAAGSANTLCELSDGRWKGYNTDAPGFLLTLHNELNKFDKALVLGTGGAATAVMAALKSRGKAVNAVSSSGRGDFGYEKLQEIDFSGFGLIVNCTPLGTFPATREAPDIPYDRLKPGQILYDLVYNPSETLFLKRGKERGCKTKNGYEMLINQAEHSWHIWHTAFIQPQSTGKK